MTHQDDVQPTGAPEGQPTMELLDGAEQAPPAQRPVLGRLVRGGLYSVLLLSASALLAISAVPELANYATFIPDTAGSSSCTSRTAACTALNVARLEGYEGSPCSVAAAQKMLAGGCSRSCGDESETLASVSAGAACCEDECPLAAVKAGEESPKTTLLTDEQLALLPEGEDLD